MTLLVVALVAVTVGRVSRHVAVPMLEEATVTSLESMALHLRRGELRAETVEAWLMVLVHDPSRTCLVVSRRGQPWVRVGAVEDAASLVGEGAELARVGSAGADVGPFRARLVGAVAIDDDHLLVMERRIHGLWTPYSTAAAATGVGVVLVGFGVAWLLAWRVYGPFILRLRTFGNALIRYGEGDTSLRLQVSEERRDEFDRLYGAFNAMAERIDDLERERRARIEAEHALLADLAHDINTPITVLRGYAETLVDRGERLEDGDRRSVFTELLGQSLYVQAIVEDLLTMARARSAELSASPVKVAVDPILDNVADSFQPLATQRGVAIIGDADGLQAWADPVRLRQILTNLVRNSLLHATGASCIELSAEEREGGTLFTVRDDGPGVPEDVVPHLFERHHRGRTKGGPGWGLGLAIVRTLAELHGGQARYRPVEGGAYFEVWLPGKPTRGE